MSLTEQQKTDALKFVEDVADEILSGKASTVFIMRIGPDGATRSRLIGGVEPCQFGMAMSKALASTLQACIDEAKKR